MAKSVFNALESEINTGSSENLVDFKTEFYQILLEGSKNELLASMHSSLRERIAFLRKTSLTLPDRPQTSLEEIRKIVATKGLTDYFAHVSGSPETKTRQTEKILGNFKLIPEETIFIGDAPEDYHAAVENNLPIIIRLHKDNRHLFKGKRCKKIDDLTTIKKYF